VSLPGGITTIAEVIDDRLVDDVGPGLKKRGQKVPVLDAFFRRHRSSDGKSEGKGGKESDFEGHAKSPRSVIVVGFADSTIDPAHVLIFRAIGGFP